VYIQYSVAVLRVIRVIKMTPDILNGLFELGGALAIVPSIKSILDKRQAIGIHWAHQLFFCSWGLWNLFYYPNLEQWFSFIGAVVLVLTNLLYTSLVWKYRIRR